MRKIFKKITDLIRENWKDPVWSKVISAIIISIGSFILGIAYFGIKSIFQSETLIVGLSKFLSFLNQETKFTLKNIYLAVLIILAFSLLLSVLRNIKLKPKNKKVQQPKIKEAEKSMYNHDHSTVFFDNRVGDAFPGLRGLKWFKDPEIAADRLQILLKPPLHFHRESPEMADPVWWFRGSSNLYIESCKKLSKTKLLIDRNEFVIKEIAAYRDDRYAKDFVYVRVKGEKPIGVYEWFPEDIERNVNTFGFFREEFGLYNNKIPITREEYDDGSAVIKGKVVKTTRAELRVRYLTDYNFIIAAKQSPYNSDAFDRNSKIILNGIIKGTHNFEQLLELFEKLEIPAKG